MKRMLVLLFVSAVLAAFVSCSSESLLVDYNGVDSQQVAQAKAGTAVTIFVDNFDTATLGSSWSIAGTADYRVQVTSAHVPYNGSYHVTLDDSTKGGYSTSELILNKDLSGYSSVSVEYYYKKYGDEKHAQDGLFVYNKRSWVKVKSFNEGPSAWTKYVVDLSAYTGITKIKWQQYDNYPMTSDGVCIDAVKVTGVPAGSGSSSSSTGGSSTWQSQSASTTSPNYPSNYPDNTDKTYTFSKSGATKMRVHFSAFDTESGYDKVYIENASGSTIATYDGSKGAFTSAEVSGSTIKVRFVSDGSVNETGFKIDSVQSYVSVATSSSSAASSSSSSAGGTAGVIFQDSFNSATLGSSWSVTGTADYRVQVTSYHVPHTTPYHVTLDDSTSGGYSQSELILSIDLRSVSGAQVEYYYKEYGDENHAQDGLFVYNNGSWVKVKSFNDGPSAWTKYVVDLSAYTGITKIKWQQYDNYPMTSDGVCIDDVKVTGVQSGTSDTTAPSVSVTSPSAGNRVGGKMTVTASASDNVGVDHVVFYKNTTIVGTDTSSPYSYQYNWNADAPNNNYTIKVVAYDAAGNSAQSSITVNKPNHDFRAMGANLADNGAFFKVWAPHATSVAIAGDFNGWDSSNNYLWNTSGFWYGFAPGAQKYQKYKFVINGNLWKPDPYGRAMENSVGSSIIEDPYAFSWTDQAYSTPTLNNMIIYELHVRSFVGKNDGQGYPGTFQSVATKLDYLKNLGINMIEIMPVGEFPGDQSWGYNTVGYFAPDSAYGTPDDLKNLVNQAHRRGIGVIMDVVYNHVGSSDNFMWDFDGDDEGGDGGIYFKNNWTEYNTPWGPAPDFGRTEVKQFFMDNAKYWLSEFKMDGLRWDATSVMKNIGGVAWDFMRDINWAVRQQFPSAVLISEQLPYDNAMMSGANFSSCWYVDFHHKTEAALKAGGYSDLNDIKTAVNGGGYSDQVWRTIYAISHDEAANGSAYLATEFGGRGDWDARAKARVAGALMLATPGIPMLFEGEEFLQDTYFKDDYDHAVNWAYEADTVGSQMEQMYKDAISARWMNEALRSPGFAWTHQDDNNKVIAFRRWSSSGNVVLVVVNLSGQSFSNHSYGVTTGQTGQWTQIFCSQDAAYGGWDGAGNAFYDPWTQGDGKIYINVPKYSITMMKLK